MRLAHATGELVIDRCMVMAIVNRTPDSFYDGGRVGLGESIDYCMAAADAGADVLDIGGVKAGPGAAVSEDEESERVVPLVEALAARSAAPFSVETGRPEVARRAVGAGASIINDVTGVADPGIASVCAETGAALVLMHHGGQLRGRPRHPLYADVVAEVRAGLLELSGKVTSHGVEGDRIVFDPGLDFGKTTFHSLELMRRLDELVALGRPLLIAPSRKDVVGEALGLPLGQRLEGSLALVALSVLGGAAIVRVHDVIESVRTVRMVEAVMGRRPPAAPVRGLWD
ncbi:MAG: dihydropteroate synthase [Actinomycetota bacterium]